MLLPGAMEISGSMTLQQPGSGVVSMALVTPEGFADAQGSGQPPEIILVSEGHVATRAIVIWMAHADTRAMVTSGPSCC